MCIIWANLLKEGSESNAGEESQKEATSAKGRSGEAKEARILCADQELVFWQRLETSKEEGTAADEKAKRELLEAEQRH